MLKTMKKILKKILPPSIFILVRELNSIRLLINRLDKKLNLLITDQTVLIKDQGIDIALREEYIKDNIQLETSIVREILWAQIYNNAVSNSDWLVKNNFAPGRWAIGYPLLYVLYSSLEKRAPASILELGLGQSTHMISQYALSHSEVKHLVVEESSAFVDYFKKTNELAPNTQIHILPYNEGTYKEDTCIQIFEGFQDLVGDQRFDLILIDAPSYNGKSIYNRIDILPILPTVLSESFVILLDDCNRRPEMNTGNEISRILTESAVPFCEGKYSGEKLFRIWCSEDLSYLTSL